MTSQQEGLQFLSGRMEWDKVHFSVITEYKQQHASCPGWGPQKVKSISLLHVKNFQISWLKKIFFFKMSLLILLIFFYFDMTYGCGEVYFFNI